MKIIFNSQVPKDLSNPELIEDIYAVSIDSGRVVLCDGASESFDSRSWAKLLADKFLRDPEIKSGWINDVVSDYRKQFDLGQMSWSKQASFVRGSFSTLLGVQFFPNESCVQITGFGDTVAFLLCEGSMIDSFPYTNVDEFQSRPKLLSTKLKHNEFLSSPEIIQKQNKKWSLDKERVYHILIMTDAMAEWALKSSQLDSFLWKKLLHLNCSDIEALVLSARNASDMKIDDATLINIVFEGE